MPPKAIPVVPPMIFSSAGLNSQRGRSSDSVTCRHCQTGLFWSWNFGTKRPCLVDKFNCLHQCTTSHGRDVFPGWCTVCHAPDLSWVRRKDGLELTESYGLPHTCQPNTIEDMSDTSCRYCKTTGLFWVKVNQKYTLTCPDGTKHICAYYGPYINDWAEAKRMNYAFEKAWLKTIPDGFCCKKCKGYGMISFFSRNKKTMRKYNSSEPIMMYRPCLKCKRLGVFTADAKKGYLKALRMKYWPYKSGVHKWNPKGQ